MKSILVILCLMASSAVHAAAYTCAVDNLVITINLDKKSATWDDGISVSPFSIAPKSNYTSKNNIAFEGDDLADTGKTIVFNTSDSTVTLYTYDVLKGPQPTIGPVSCDSAAN